MKAIIATLTLATTTFLSSCATPSTPQTRIDANPALYQALPKKHQALVSQGKLTKGMSEPAVFLAWGNPSSKSEGMRNDDLYQTWTYSHLTPHLSHSIHSGFGYGHGFGYGRYVRYRSPYYGFGVSPRVFYTRKPVAKVSFRNGKVREWERRTR